jgi:hypothetical protein
MVEEYIWDRIGGVKWGIIIRGQVFSCTSDCAGFSRRPLDTGIRWGPAQSLVTGGWCSFPDPWG